MAAAVACIHTASSLVELFRDLTAKKAPKLRVLQLVDEPILVRIRNRGKLDSTDVERLASHIRVARDAGAGPVLVTCSTLSPCVDELPPDLREGVLKVDDPLMQAAVARSGHLILAATLEPSAQTLRLAAQAAGKHVEPEMALISDAYEAFLSSDFATHDPLLIDGVLNLAERADTIVFAQASMARVMDRLPDHVRAKVLSSPELAVDALVSLVGS